MATAAPPQPPTTRTLLPQLPPELRNSVYSSLAPSPPTNTGLPLSLKTYSCKHTLVQLLPTHNGSTSLLALHHASFIEATEYRTWLLNNGITLHIGVVFKGRVNTFVQEHWDRKIEAHLSKLAKQFPWLRKVASYEIEILWDAPDGVLKSKGNRRCAGEIPRAMVRTLTGLMDAGTRRKGADVRARLRLEHHVAGVAVRSTPRFGLGGFVALVDEEVGVGGRCTAEVWKEPCPRVLPRKSSRLTPVVTKVEEKQLLRLKDGRLEWVERAQGTLVMRKSVVGEKQLCASFMDTGIAYDSPTELMLFELLEDCRGRRWGIQR